ncbi:MAG TPA: alpha/beta hydrolase [Planctomycetes bacterium]|nr:alpha/beta hydrolase [Planctomycetota bacterium]
MPCPGLVPRAVLAAALSCVSLPLAGCTSVDSGAPGKSAPAIHTHLAGEAAPLPTTPPLVVPAARWLDRDLTPLEAGRTVLYYDLAGRGRSAPLPENAPVNLEREVADLESVRAANGFERIAILGWGYQGAIALRYALAHPDRTAALVLIAPLPARRDLWERTRSAFEARIDPRAVARLEKMRAGPGKRRDPLAYARGVLDASLAVFVPDPQARARMKSDPVVLPNLDPDLAARRKRRALHELGDWDWTEDLSRLEVPTLVLHGDRGLVPIESDTLYADTIRGARLVRLPDAGDMPWLDAPDEFFPTVEAFLSALR